MFTKSSNATLKSTGVRLVTEWVSQAAFPLPASGDLSRSESTNHKEHRVGIAEIV